VGHDNNPFNLTGNDPGQETLRTSETRYRRLLETAQDGILILDAATGAITDVNPFLLEMLGYSREECLGKRLWELGPFKDVEASRAAFQELQKIEYSRYEDLPLETRDGRLIDVEFVSNAYQVDGERVIQCNICDITRRKRAEESRVLLAAIVESSGDAILGVKFDGTISTWNKGAETLYGYTPEEAMGHNVSLIVPEDRIDEIMGVLGRVKNGEPILPYESVRKRKDGKLLNMSIGASPIWDSSGQVIGISIIGRDISGLKRAEEARTRLALAVENIAESVVITETDGAILYVNPAFEKITGYRREEVLGQNPRLLNNGKQNQEFYQAMWATLKQGGAWTGVFINKKKDGTLYEAQAVISPVRDEAGRVINYVGIERDVTHEKHLEEQLRQSQKMEAIGQLAGGIAHDFNNLLTIITGYGQLLLEELEPNDPRRVKMGEINKAAARAVSLTRQLLAFGRRQVLVSEVLDLNAVLSNLEKMLRRLISEDIELVIVQGEALGRVRADSGQIEQVIMNLAVNARDAIPHGGKLTLETSNVDLDEAYAASHPEVAPGPYVMLAVRDDGCGISQEAQTRIFEPFFTTKEKGKGTGLGLSTVYGIVRQSEGYVSVDSEPWHGATFKIYLPRVEEQAGLQAWTEEGAGEPPRGSETILLVEDEEALRSLVQDVLEELGYKILPATRGDEAIAICKQHPAPIPLLLTDVVMPGMSGRELADHLKFLYPGMKLLYMSGYTEDAMLRRGILGPEAAFLGKPFTPRAIARKVREVLDHINNHEK
jgi:PAS domain S-box-containing protein